jgi:hypothetical protein
MTTSTIEVFQKAADLGLKLGFESPNTLTLQPANRCSAGFANTLKDYKPQLLALLQLPFCMVYSRTLEANVIFCEDEETKAALVEAGADEWSIYTKAELRVLIAHNRVKPFLPHELCKLHKLKRTFNGRIII